MKTLYIECSMGAAGDMLTAALLELHPDPAGFIKRLNALDIPKVEVSWKKAEKCGIMGTRVTVLIDGEEENEPPHEHEHRHEHEHDHHHEHSHEHGHHHEHEHHHEHRHFTLGDTERLIMSLNLPEKVKKDACAVYRIIADAESEVHGKDVYEIHFHEVGNMDAVADVVGVCMLINELSPDRILASAVHVGSGTVKCAHGVLPVPAPATALILEGVPIYSGEVQGELCTPTGAALLKYFASDFCPMPPIKVEKTGYGIGTKDFETANVLRVFLGETEKKEDGVYELCANIDDMTGEDVAYAAECILKGGALDVYTVPIGMKKGRPGVMLCALCKDEDREKTARLIFKHTTTIGLRERFFARRTLERRDVTLETNFGVVRGKESSGYGVKKVKPEHDDLEKIANENGVSIGDIEITY